MVAPRSPASDVYDDIQLQSISFIDQLTGERIVHDTSIYHLGDQTVAEIKEMYNEGRWQDPNPPEFWAKLHGTFLEIEFNDQQQIITPQHNFVNHHKFLFDGQ